MLTGDSREVGEAVAERLGIDKVHAGLHASVKVRIVEDILHAKPEKKKSLSWETE